MPRFPASVPLVLLSLLALAIPAPAKGPPDPEGLPEVELIHAGREPRVPLRYEFRAGLEETLEIEMASTLGVTVDGQGGPRTRLPTTRLVFSVKYEEVTPEGDLRYSFVLKEASIEDRAGLDPAALDKIRAETEKLVGTRGHALVSPRGVTKEGETTLPAHAGAAVRQTVENLESQLRQLSAPLPEEPVGEGARWSVTEHVTVSGVEVDQTLTFRVLSLRDGKAVLKVKGLQAAKPQAMKLPELPSRATARLDRLTGKARGTVMLDLKTVIPRFDCGVDLEMECTVTADGRTAKLRLEMDLETAIHRTVAVVR